MKNLFQKTIKLGISQTAKSIYWVFTGNGVSIFIAFFTTIIIARFLTKEEFGIYLALYTFAALLSDLGDMGIGPSLSNFIPPLNFDKKYFEMNEILGSSFYLELFLGIVIMILILLLASVIAKIFFGGISLIYIILTLILMLTILLFNFSILALSAQKKFKESAFVNMLSSIVRISLLVLIVYKSQLTLANVIIIYALSLFVAWFYSLFILKVDFIKHFPTKQTVLKLIRFSGFLGLQKVFITISSRLDMLMLVPLAGSLATGIYGAASRLTQVYPFFISSFSQVTAPKYAEYQDKSQVWKFFLKTIIITFMFLLSVFILYLFADKFILLLFPKYIESIQIFRALLWSMVAFLLASPFTTLIVYTFKKPMIVAIATGVQLIIIFLGNLFFIPIYGAIGPAISSTIGNLAILFICASSVGYFFIKKI